MALLLSALLLGACTDSEAPEAAAALAEGAETVVTIRCTAPQLAERTSRSFGDGTGTTRLYYAMYLGDANAPDATLTFVQSNFADTTYIGSENYLQNDIFFTVGSDGTPHADAPLRVVMGQTYTVIFFASTENCPYTYSPDDFNLLMNYDLLPLCRCNDEARDGFFNHVTFTAVKSDSNPVSVTLTRPFAQLNVGNTTEGWQYAADNDRVPSFTGITVEGVPSALNLLTGEVSGSAYANFAVNTIPERSEAFPTVSGADLCYLAMTYVLVNEKATYTITLNADTYNAANGDPWRIENVPMQRNYRTNVYGDFLSYTGKYQVELVPGFDVEGSFAGTNLGYVIVEVP